MLQIASLEGCLDECCTSPAQFSWSDLPSIPRRPIRPRIEPKRRNMRMLMMLSTTGMYTPDIHPSLDFLLGCTGPIVPSLSPRGSGDSMTRIPCFSAVYALHGMSRQADGRGSQTTSAHDAARGSMSRQSRGATNPRLTSSRSFLGSKCEARSIHEGRLKH
jgi:hypothetical protein